MIQLRQPKFTHLKDFTGTGLNSYIYRNKEFILKNILVYLKKIQSMITVNVKMLSYMQNNIQVLMHHTNIH